MRTVRKGDRVDHWNYGEGLVVREAHSKDDVPIEWQHDWKSVVLVEFLGECSTRIDREWVLQDDLDIFEACNYTQAVVQ